MEPSEKSYSQTIKLPPIRASAGKDSSEMSGPLVQYDGSPLKKSARNASLNHPSSISNSLMKRLYKRSPSIGKTRFATVRPTMNQSLATHSYNLLEDLPLKPRLPKSNRLKLPALERPGPLKMGGVTIQEGQLIQEGSSPRARDLLDMQGGDFGGFLEIQANMTQPNATMPVLPYNQKQLPAPARKKPRQLGSEKLSNAFISNFEAMKKPTPHDFIRLLQSDKRYEQRFCYCKKTSPEFYQFEVVPYAIKDPNQFMTISARGIVHYIGDEVDYLSLSEWQREARMYKQIKEIFFFRQYRYWKNFTLWKTLMRRTRIHTQRDYLRTKLLITDPELGEPLQIIRTTTFRLT